MTNRDFIESVLRDFEVAYALTGMRPTGRKWRAWWGDERTTGCALAIFFISEKGGKEFCRKSARPSAIIREVGELLRRRTPRGDKPFFEMLAAFIMQGHDGTVTYPRRWLGRACADECPFDEATAKLAGAAVGHILWHRAAVPAPREVVPAPAGTCEKVSRTIANSRSATARGPRAARRP